MTKLANLHARLRRLKRRRQSLRWGTGYSALAVAVLWVLVGTFLADWLFHMNRPQRVVLMVIGAGVLVWAFRRYTRPWLGTHESEVDMALMVERQKHIDTDLVAALQFESPEAPTWGSVELEDAVIDNTARLSSRLDVTESLPRAPLARRTKILLVTAALVAAGIGFYPDYAATFFKRLLLGSDHYPTATIIETVKINRREVDFDGQPHAVVEGQPVRFEVTWSGRLPHTGRAELEIPGGAGTTVVLDPTDEDRTVFAGELARLADPVRYQIFLGDAWTDPAELTVVRLPTIEVTLDVTPPDYAAGPEATSGPQTGLRQISVIEGSQVRVRIAADKLLKKAVLSIDEDGYAMTHQTDRESEGGGDPWVLEPGQSPLAAVVEPLRYSIDVTDVHDLQLERPLQGVIRIKADRRPRVTAGILTEYILPTARPTVAYEVWDDYGVARVSIRRQVVHEDGQTEEDEVELYKLADGARPESTRQALQRLDLSRLNLVKGDQLRMTVCGTDHRGPRQGETGFSEPLVFQVTDVAGILAAISEADKRSARELKEMIRRQINVGDEP